MVNQLYFICPTDGIESKINGKFDHENYFVSSVGLSFSFNSEFLDELFKLIIEKNIDRVTFVLSDQNKIVTEIIDGKDYSIIQELNKSKSQVHKEFQAKKMHWSSDDLILPIIAKFLESRAQDLKSKLIGWSLPNIKVETKIYRSNTNQFSNLPSGLFEREAYNLN